MTAERRDGMIEVRELRKIYGELVAVDGVSLDVAGGEILGLLGPNGAGKSTTIGCVSGLLTPTSGRVRLLGHDVAREPREARRHLGLVPQEMALYEDLSARENLTYWAGAYGLRGQAAADRVERTLEVVGLRDRADETVEEFSGGMKRRLNFGCGIVHGPRVLLLDEPTVGVDAQSRVRLQELVREQADDGAAVLYTTHYMEEAETLCDRIAVIDHGEVIARGSLEELQNLHGEKDVVRLSGRFSPDRIRDALPGDGVDLVTAEEDQVVLAVREGSRRLPELLGAVSGAGGEIRETVLTRPSLEGLFIKLTGRELRE
jgi:ABC-2 type transport system ATP-binding protein